MNLDTFFSSVITATSIMIAVEIPLIIYLVTEYNNRKEKLLSEMKALYPKLNLFRELIYCISLVEIWKNKKVVTDYNAAYRNENRTLMAELSKKNDFLILHRAYKNISEQYSKDIMSNSKRIFSYKEIEEFRRNANTIWYSIDCRNDIILEIDTNSFLELNKWDLERIKKIILKISPEYSTDTISIETIANISGDLEVTIIDSLLDLSWNYERPLESIVKKLYAIMAISLVFGVVVPLILLLFSFSNSIFYFSIIIVVILIICFLAIVFYTGKYIGIC